MLLLRCMHACMHACVHVVRYSTVRYSTVSSIRACLYEVWRDDWRMGKGGVANGGFY